MAEEWTEGTIYGIEVHGNNITLTLTCDGSDIELGICEIVLLHALQKETFVYEEIFQTLPLLVRVKIGDGEITHLILL